MMAPPVGAVPATTVVGADSSNTNARMHGALEPKQRVHTSGERGDQHEVEEVLEDV